MGFLFRKLAKTERELATVPLAPPITAHISLVTRKKKIPFLAMEGLKDFLRHADLFANENSVMSLTEKSR